MGIVKILSEQSKWFWQNGLSIDETKTSILIICLLICICFGGYAYSDKGDITNNLTSIIQTLIVAIAGVNVSNRFIDNSRNINNSNSYNSNVTPYSNGNSNNNSNNIVNPNLSRPTYQNNQINNSINTGQSNQINTGQANGSKNMPLDP